MRIEQMALNEDIDDFNAVSVDSDVTATATTQFDCGWMLVLSMSSLGQDMSPRRKKKESQSSFFC
jgi:hypothetical protein